MENKCISFFMQDVTLENLCVLEFNIAGITDDVWGWEKDAPIFSPENCARRIWIGTQDDFESFPYDGVPDYKYMVGTEAYTHLLDFYSCLTDGNAIDTHNRAQFLQRWAVLKDGLREKFGGLMRSLSADSGVINRKLLSRYENPRYEVVARDISDVGKHDAVLIIGALNGKGSLSGYTMGMINTIENKQKDNNSRCIAITHPDPNVLAAIRAEIGKAKTQKPRKIHSDIQIIDFKELPTAFELYDKAFVTLPMGEYPEADAEIVALWRNRERKCSALVHLHGCVESQGASIAPWTELGADDLILAEDIRAEKVRREGRNKAIFVQARQSFEVCANIRAQGSVPKVTRIMEAAGPEIFEL